MLRIIFNSFGLKQTAYSQDIGRPKVYHDTNVTLHTLKTKSVSIATGRKLFISKKLIEIKMCLMLNTAA